VVEYRQWEMVMSDAMRAALVRAPLVGNASQGGGGAGAAAAERKTLSARPRSDVGTVVIHLATATVFFVSLFTGIRIAADNPNAVVSRWLSPILPQGEVWTWHFLAGLGLFFCASAYVLYMRRSALSRRAAPRRLKVLLLPVVSKLRYVALNVALHWFNYLLVVVMTATGILLYFGHGGWLVTVHSAAAFTALAYVVVHVVTHYLMGGVWQLLRVIRPVPLQATRLTRSRPLLIGLAAGVAVTAALAGTDLMTRDTLVVRHVQDAPRLDRLLDDPVWGRVRPVTIRTQQGINLGGTGESVVAVRAVHDGKKIYFAFQWEDPSRSVRRNPLIKREDGWHILADNPYRDDVTTNYEDKFAVIFSTVASFGSGGTSHFGPQPLSDKLGSRNGRGLHYTDGHMVDMWQWKPSRGGLRGVVDDMYIGPPREPTPAEVSRVARYQGGYWPDPGTAYYVYNFEALRPSDYREGQPVGIKRLPRDLAALQKGMGHWDPDPNGSVDDGSVWWMTEENSMPYSPEEDAKIPVGTIIPGVLHIGEYSGDRADVSAAAHWQDGHWTLIASRALDTGSKYDQAFAPGRDLYMWVAVFDHTQTRHTRHPRPVRIAVEE
jgi:hypothetical protein